MPSLSGKSGMESDLVYSVEWMRIYFELGKDSTSLRCTNYGVLSSYGA